MKIYIWGTILRGYGGIRVRVVFEDIHLVENPAQKWGHQSEGSVTRYIFGGQSCGEMGL